MQVATPREIDLELAGLEDESDRVLLIEGDALGLRFVNEIEAVDRLVAKLSTA